MQTWPEIGDTGGSMRFDTIIRNGTIVTATDSYAGDVGITNGQITAIGRDLPIENTNEILDAKVLVVCVLDPRTESLTVYDNDNPPSVLYKGVTLTLPDLLPGFELPIARLFE